MLHFKCNFMNVYKSNIQLMVTAKKDFDYIEGYQRELWK